MVRKTKNIIKPLLLSQVFDYEPQDDKEESEEDENTDDNSGMALENESSSQN